jgi:hypothetical protein
MNNKCFYSSFVLGSFSFKSSSSVDQYTFIDERLCSANLGGKPVIFAQFIIGRNIVGALLTNFLPIFISAFIGHITNYIKRFEIAAGTNVTVLLVLVTL